jgi:hypothetical protein
MRRSAVTFIPIAGTVDALLLMAHPQRWAATIYENYVHCSTIGLASLRLFKEAGDK